MNVMNQVKRKEPPKSSEVPPLFTSVKVYSLQQQAMPILQKYLNMLDSLRNDYSWEYLQENFYVLSRLWCSLRGWKFKYDGKTVTIDALETPLGCPPVELEASR